jgi:hypothetical protein
MRTTIRAAASRPDAFLAMESDFGRQQRLGSATSDGGAQGGDPPDETLQAPNVSRLAGE